MPPPPDHHPDLGIMYAGGDAATSLLEAFQATRVVNRRRNSPWVATFALARSVRLLDIGGSWPTRAGASQALGVGDASAVTQAWARAIYSDYPDVAGILYPSSMRGRRKQSRTRAGADLIGRNIALFERAEAALPTHPRMNMPLDHPGLADPLAVVADEYGYDIV